MDQGMLPMDVGLGGFGAPDLNEYREIQRSLEAGYNVAAYSDTSTGSALIPQSLEKTLTIVTKQKKHLKLWRQFPKDPERLNATTHEFVRLTDIGPDLPAFQPEAEVGPQVDETFEKLWAKVKYLSVQKDVTDPMAVLRNLVGGSPALQRANENGMFWLSVQLERALWTGNESLNPYSFNGLRRVIELEQAAKPLSERIIDMRGEPVDPDQIHDLLATLIDQPNYGDPTAIWMPIALKTDLGKIGGQYVKYDNPEGMSDGKRKLGLEAVGIIGPDGVVPFETTIFLSPAPLSITTSIGTNPPTAPSVTPVTSNVATTYFTSAYYGTYQFAVRAVGSKGVSARTLVQNVVVDATHDQVQLQIAAPSSDNVLYYEIYQSVVGETALWKVAEVAQTYSGGNPAQTDVNIINDELPGTMQLYVLQLDNETCEWKQLLDVARVPLARTRLSQPFAFCMFGMPLWKAPQRFGMVRNIGRLEKEVIS